jgi:transcription initiation factor TFIIH subunit 3
MSILDKRSNERSLMVMVLDVSPVVWRMRSAFREKSDQSRRAKGKESVGPGILEEILSSIQLWCGAFATLQRECALLIIGVAGNATSTLFPRKDALQSYFLKSGGRKGDWDWESLPSQFLDGVAELIQQNHAAEDTSAMAAGLSIALCHVNRFLVAHHSGSKAAAAGVSALYHDPSTLVVTNDDKDVISLIGNNNASTSKRRNAIQSGYWSPRILLIQASNDRSQDYNAFMNCTFAAVKQNIV